jgi:hypothetical protein
MGHRLDGRSSIPGRDVIFVFEVSRPALGPIQPSIQWVLGDISPGVEWPERDAHH